MTMTVAASTRSRPALVMMTSSFSVGVPRRVRTRSDSAISSRVRGAAATIAAFLLFTFSAMPPLSRMPQKAAVSCFAFILASRTCATLQQQASSRKKGKLGSKTPAFAHARKLSERKSPTYAHARKSA